MKTKLNSQTERQRIRRSSLGLCELCGRVKHPEDKTHAPWCPRYDGRRIYTALASTLLASPTLTVDNGWAWWLT